MVNNWQIGDGFKEKKSSNNIFLIRIEYFRHL